MPARFLLPLCVAFACCALDCAVVRAQNEGQEDLDRAVELKPAANSFEELSEVIDLYQSALDKGLDEQSRDFAQQLLAGALLQRGTAISQVIFQGSPADPRWRQQFPQLREMALADLTRVTSLDPEQKEAQFLIGRLQALPGGDLKAAIAALDETIRLSEDDPSLRVKALIARGSLQEDPEQRLADYNAAVELNPEGAEALRARGIAFLEQDKVEEGLADLDAALKIDPDHPGTYELRGVALAAQKKFDEALASLDKAIELEPRSPLAYVHRGRIRIAQEQAAEAIHDFDKALLLQPSSTSVLLLRAGAHQQLGQAEQALADVEHALKLKPGLVPALRARAILEAAAGDFDEAITDLKEVIAAEPQDTEPLLQLAMVYNAQKEIDQAIQTFSDVIELEPKNALAYQGRADTYLRVGKQAEALADYEQASELDPENTAVLNNLAWLLATSPHEEVRDGKRAIEIATEACRLTEYKKPHILSTLAAAYAEAGDFKTAIEWSTKAVELGDEDELAGQLQKELESYQSGKPWREIQNELEEAQRTVDEPVELPTIVPDDEPAVDPGAKADKADKANE